MKPEVVVFDLGKVLVDFDYGVAARRIAARCPLSPEELQRMMDHSPLLFRMERGEISSRHFFDAVCDLTGYGGSFEEFGTAFGDIFTPMEEMVELHRELKQRGVPRFIFSNTNDLAVAHIRRAFAFFNEFNGYVLSYQQGALKPDPKLYQVLEEMAARKGPEILYIDDREENLATGAARGWQVILQQEPATTIRAVRELGLLG